MKRLLFNLLIWLISLCLFVQPANAATQLTWLEGASTNAVEFKKALTPQTWQFPQDFGAHEDYQTEWCITPET